MRGETWIQPAPYFLPSPPPCHRQWFWQHRRPLESQAPRPFQSLWTPSLLPKSPCPLWNHHSSSRTWGWSQTPDPYLWWLFPTLPCRCWSCPGCPQCCPTAQLGRRGTWGFSFQPDKCKIWKLKKSRSITCFASEHMLNIRLVLSNVSSVFLLHLSCSPPRSRSSYFPAIAFAHQKVFLVL